ncbi:hypothetical protein RCH09_003903 [Actimicrobium sp. GrIS 1.19]|uniref:DUF1906 domain-containing protein n=1 Tax=Actimicrobium sp. GrIS 1.19 TaxID=3071708 RepID=UPI002E0107C4|nr:hypothetical protein [Actimicrobium sp. GrIS 1.19]
MPSLKGLNCPISLTEHATELSWLGFDFVRRQYSNDPLKNLTQSETLELFLAGLQIGVVWEPCGTDAACFSGRHGARDGRAARELAIALGQPIGSAIYFAVDFDATLDDIGGPISDYFAAVRGTLHGKYQTGVHASARCCETLRAARLVDLTWLAQADCDAVARDAMHTLDYNLIQSGRQDITVSGNLKFRIDLNASNADVPTGLFGRIEHQPRQSAPR